jgi:hypothetical protein
MNLEKSIQNLINGSPKEVNEAKKDLEMAFNKKTKKKIAFNLMISNLGDFYFIDKEKNKIAFIYGLSLAAKNRGKEYFPLFTSFITKNIQSDSGNVRQAVIRLTDSLINSMISGSEDLSKKEKQVFTEFIDEVLILLETYYDSKYEEYADIKEIPACKYKSLEILLSKIMNPGKKEKQTHKKNAGMPEWMDCTWKRVPCMSDDCPICSRLKELDQTSNLFERGELLIELAGQNEDDKDDLPKPEEFPFYKEIREWMEFVISLAEKSKRRGEFWIFTEEAADLFWYINVLSAKIYRQLCNRYHIDKGRETVFIDYKYTNYVLKETIKIIKKALKEIIKSDPEEKENILNCFNELSDMEERILNI